MLLHAVDHSSPTGMHDPKSDIGLGKTVSFEERQERILHQSRRQMTNFRAQDDAQLPFTMFKANAREVLGIEERFEIHDRRERPVGQRPANQEAGSRAIGTDGIADDCLQTIVAVITGGTKFDSQHQADLPGMGSRKVASALQAGDSASATKSDDRGSLNARTKSHMPNQTAGDVRAYISSRGAQHKQVHILWRQIGSIETPSCGPAPKIDSASQIAPVQLVGGLVKQEPVFKVKVTVFDASPSKDFSDRFAAITQLKESLLLADAEAGRGNTGGKD